MSTECINEIVEGFENTADSMLNGSMVTEEEDAPSPGETQGTIEDPALDPSFEKEYFLKTIEMGDHVVTLKTIGIGKNKPVSVHIDGLRWEMFPGPIRAEKEAKTFIKSDHFEKWLERLTKPAPEEDSADETSPTPKTDTKDSEAKGSTEVDTEKNDDNDSSEDEKK